MNNNELRALWLVIIALMALVAARRGAPVWRSARAGAEMPAALGAGGATFVAGVFLDCGQGPQPGLLDPFKPYLHERFNVGHTAARLTAEITAMGYRGSDKTVRRYLPPSGPPSPHHPPDPPRRPCGR